VCQWASQSSESPEHCRCQLHEVSTYGEQEQEATNDNQQSTRNDERWGPQRQSNSKGALTPDNHTHSTSQSAVPVLWTRLVISRLALPPKPEELLLEGYAMRRGAMRPPGTKTRRPIKRASKVGSSGPSSGDYNRHRLAVHAPPGSSQPVAAEGGQKRAPASY
jgi:hypothetical protein